MPYKQLLNGKSPPKSFENASRPIDAKACVFFISTSDRHLLSHRSINSLLLTYIDTRLYAGLKIQIMKELPMTQARNHLIKVKKNYVSDISIYLCLG